MYAKMGASLGSPTLAATTAGLRNRLPTQLRRCLPIYIAGAIVGLMFLQLFRSGMSHRVDLSQPLNKDKDATTVPTTTVISAPTARADFPKKIWQMWKVAGYALAEDEKERTRTWTDMNPGYRYEMLTDGNEMSYVEYHYGPEGLNRPDIVEFYRNINAIIVKADLLRYLVMYAEGGVYADFDVEAMKPLDSWVPERYDHKDLDMIIGVEIDEPDWKDHPILGPKSRSFCQWTFVCKPRLPVMMHLIEQVMHWLSEVAQSQNQTISDVDLNFDQVISGTGPSAFTTAIMADMNARRTDDRPITWDDFHYLTESKAVSRFLVLTVEAFAAGQGHSNSGNHESRAALIRHHYHASHWPDRHPRYHHPAYAEIEKCNWEDECIHKWDENVNAFNAMSYEDQQRVVAEQEAERKKKEEEEEKARQEEARKAEEDEAEERRKHEEDARRAAEAEEAKRKAEAEEAKKRAEEEKLKAPPPPTPQQEIKP